MALGQRVKQAREAMGLTQEDLGQLVGMSQAAIHILEKRDSKSTGKVLRLAKALKTTPEYLLTGNDNSAREPEGKAGGQPEGEWLGPLDAWGSDTPLHEDEIELPLFREVEMAAGGGRTQVLENHGAKLRFARSTLRRAGVDPANAGCAVVKGNSMDNRIPDGTTIGVDKGSTEIRDGDIYAIDHGGMFRVKYLYRMPGGGLKLASENEDEHPAEVYSADQVREDIRVIGRIFWYSVLM